MIRSLLTFSTLLLGLVDLRLAYVINSDPNYRPWPNGVVYFAFRNGEYNSSESDLIRQAMQQITTDMSGCIQFKEFTLPAQSGLKYVVISRNGGLQGAPGQSCYTFPGMVVSQTGQGQYVAMQGGVNGCLSSVKQAMRILASLLGLRSEHNKPNRNTYIRIVPANINSVGTVDNVFNMYDSSKVQYSPIDFDYNSITLIDQSTFSAGGLTYVVPPNFILPKTGRLSLNDCLALNYLYSCNVLCMDPYGPNSQPVFLPFPTPSIPGFPTMSTTRPIVVGPTTSSPVRPDYRK